MWEVNSKTAGIIVALGGIGTIIASPSTTSPIFIILWGLLMLLCGYLLYTRGKIF